MEYVESQTVRGDLGIALRAIPALFYGEGVAISQDVVSILDISIHNMTMSDALEWIVERAAGDSPGQVCFVNADCANMVYRNRDYQAMLHESELVLADGIGMKLAGKLLGCEIRQNVNGTDLFPRLCESLSGTGAGIFLLGAGPGVAEKVRDWIVRSTTLLRWSAAITTDISPLLKNPRSFARSTAPALRFCSSPSERRARTCGSTASSRHPSEGCDGRGRPFGFLSRPHPACAALDAGGGRRMALPLLSGAAAHVATVFCRQRGLSCGASCARVIAEP